MLTQRQHCSNKKEPYMTHDTSQHIEHLIWHINLLSRSLPTIQPNSAQAHTLVAGAERNLVMVSEMLIADITCLGCGCTSHSQCATKDGWGCYWLTVDYNKKQGVCSKCSQALPTGLESDAR
ncbi:MAG: hypothetical protein COB71_01225 [Thiotrichales bacterium]|nr:MAG: hypothetical protein COB71_01225 [Thiotrichales bacterium]